VNSHSQYVALPSSKLGGLAKETSNDKTPLDPTTISEYVFPKKQKLNGKGIISLQTSSIPTMIGVP
jgi:hypothetical protein